MTAVDGDGAIKAEMKASIAKMRDKAAAARRNVVTLRKRIEEMQESIIVESDEAYILEAAAQTMEDRLFPEQETT
jgi:hypothetical protein